jgi:hypothetical protein
MRPFHRGIVLNRRLRFIVALVLLALGYTLVFRLYDKSQSNSPPSIWRWFRDPSSHAELATIRQGVACPGAPFILPSDGLIGLLWDDPAGPYTVVNPHSGIDIFGDGEPREVPVHAAYEGYLTRLPEWVSSVIIRHDDPLQPGRTIWTYYTHMASRDGAQSFIVDDFPAGSSEVWVEQGTLLGYQGEYAGSTGAIGLHVHFSVVLSDGDGAFRNEARIGNTLDPTPYLGMTLNIAALPQRPITCGED